LEATLYGVCLLFASKTVYTGGAMIEQAAVSVVFSNGRNDRSVTGAGRLDVRDPQPGNRIKHATSTYISPCCQERDLRFLGRQRERRPRKFSQISEKKQRLIA
jgi:hypothetical protein